MNPSEESVRCQVVGCRKEPIVQVYWRDEYPAHHDVYQKPCARCQYLCEEHLYINESGRVGEVEPRGIAAYPFVNKGAIDQGWCEYQWLSNGEWVDRELLPLVDVDPGLMPPPIVEVEEFKFTKEWFMEHLLEQAQRRQLSISRLCSSQNQSGSDGRLQITQTPK